MKICKNEVIITNYNFTTLILLPSPSHAVSSFITRREENFIKGLKKVFNVEIRKGSDHIKLLT